MLGLPLRVNGPDMLPFHLRSGESKGCDPRGAAASYGGEFWGEVCAAETCGGEVCKGLPAAAPPPPPPPPPPPHRQLTAVRNWGAQAGGNFALALMLTVICSTLGVFTVPLMLDQVCLRSS